MTVNSFYGPNTYGTNETPTQGETVKATVSGGWTEYNNKTLYPEGGMYAYLADVTITPSTASKVAPYVYYYRVWRVDDEGNEILINHLPENTGKGWGTDYYRIKTYYPIGNETRSPLQISDIYVDKAFPYGGEKCINYIVRMYATPSPFDDGSNAKSKIIIESKKIHINEATVSIVYNTEKQITTGTGDATPDKSIVSVKYYNMLGIEADTPFDGVNIKVVKHADGSISQTKIIK